MAGEQQADVNKRAADELRRAAAGDHSTASFIGILEQLALQLGGQFLSDLIKRIQGERPSPGQIQAMLHEKANELDPPSAVEGEAEAAEGEAAGSHSRRRR
jgi:hypothetical protein